MTTRGAKRAATSDPGAPDVCISSISPPGSIASWVQSQLQNHPAELWDDGLKDYIFHASEIMEKFKDVVNWLRQNKAGSTVVSSPSPLKDEKTNSPAADDSKLLVQPSLDSTQKAQVMASSSSAFQSSSSPTPNISSFPSKSQTPDFSGMFGDKNNTSGDNSKPPFQFGVNNAIFGDKKNPSGDSTKPPFQFGANNGIFGDKKNTPGDSRNQNTSEASADADEDAEPEKPSSPSVKKAEEKGIVVVHEAKCKVYVKHDDATKGWKDIGVGQLSIRCKEGAEKASKESTPTIVIRNDVGKILLNALIYKGIKMNVQKNTVASIFHTSDAQSDESSGGAVVAQTYLFRLKNEEEATNLSTAIKENAPSD
ncbi:hypothetical protein BAE44_0002356 [Dichanthelium oligosanthes]|uniref:RanBD1 domain-containing protein n=1 Tax=Dichanthelium oligosanthes TaxID=888268 RepID=A0A1E5WGU7_9POAL|nr:hypothetical protein BAE44_0002356 [Dichanthelium oligosanthes]